ncbi:MAG: hypothetical protein ACREFL_02110, partial [Stellaceae bacterium]
TAATCHGFSAIPPEEGRMTQDALSTNRPAKTLFHPIVYRVIIALAALLAVSAWGFFADSETGYVLAVVSGFVFMIVALPSLLWRIRRHGHDPRLRQDGSSERAGSLMEWLRSDFETWQERLTGWDAVAASLLPIAACAFLMLTFAIMFQFAVPS